MDNAVLLAADEAPTGGGMNTMMIVFLALMIGVMFFMSRRNKKQQQKQADFRDKLEAGQRVMTAGGMVGVISEVEGDVVTIMSPSGDRSAYVRRAIRSQVPDDEWEAMLAPYAADDEPDEADEPGEPDELDEPGEPDAADEPDEESEDTGK
ncbi:MAG: preprotein translocase subunit YajC [Bifidobacteriaceae bacterium]|jgi:preprotein translocase subunit YajC|nr:preprotein translocase subunit YajC [Bifidobacteriaceae bacterium]